jgi:ubiquinone/menaquinone biosynthesis C-methylase UbiE
MKQVNASHYSFESYMRKERWNSVWHQLDEIIKLQPLSVLEVGPGSGLFKSIAMSFGLKIETVDVDPELKPDYVGSAIALPFREGQFEVACAFQVLEHLPFEDSLKAFAEMVRVSSKFVAISLPNVRPVWRYHLFIPKFGIVDKLVSRPFWRPKQHTFDGQHYWELSKEGFSFPRVVKQLSKGCRLIKSFRVTENPYHHFLIFECQN